MIGAVSSLPRIIIIDDLFGRTHRDRRNEERANLCGQYLLEDVTGDEKNKGVAQIIKQPIAQAVFYRGQKPACSVVGDVVENDLEGTLQTIRRGWENLAPGSPRWALVLLDLCFYTGKVTEESSRRTLGMPEGREGDNDPQRYFGLRILEAINEDLPDLPVVILSSKSRERVSREFSYRGAFGFLAREEEQSPALLQKYIWSHGLIPDEAGEIVGQSKALLLALRAARRAGSNRRNILIRGERGTGKELLARYVHRQNSTERRRPYVTVNSGALLPDLYASELFGHRRGAFTGASSDRTGRILEANGGDLFFDEIGNMPLDVQIGLLRVLEYREVVPLGKGEGQSVDVRFISATNKDIETSASVGEFRLALRAPRGEGGTFLPPPLRERMEDVPLLVEKFVRDAEHAHPDALKRQVDPETMELLCSYTWPGNIRELRNCLFNAVNDYPDVEHLVKVHLHLPAVNAGHKSGDYPRQRAAGTTSAGLEGNKLNEVVQLLDSFSFEDTHPEEIGREHV